MVGKTGFEPLSIGARGASILRADFGMHETARLDPSLQTITNEASNSKVLQRALNQC
jgi:hypothetical protein